MDFKKFYLSAEGRVNRKQFWLWLALPLTVIGVLLASIDIASGNYNPETGIGLFTGIFAPLTLIPTIIVYVKRFHDRDKSCPFRKSYPDILVMQPCQDRNGANGARSLDCSMKRRIFL